MSHRQKLEQVLELLINEDHDAASDLLHSVIVEKARTMYEDLVDEDFGGDEKEDFAGEIEADKDEIETDEIYDDEEGEEGEDEPSDDDDDDDDEDEVEDRLEDVESQLAELRAEFDQIVNGGDVVGDDSGFEDEVAVGDEFAAGDEFGDDEYAEESMYEEIIDELEEATKLQDTVADTGQGSEGKLAGTGKTSKVGATNTKSLFTKVPGKADHGGKPHKTGVGGDESTKKVGEGEDNTPTSNIKVKQSNQSAADKNKAGDDKGAKSPLGSSGSPKGN